MNQTAALYILRSGASSHEVACEGRGFFPDNPPCPSLFYSVDIGMKDLVFDADAMRQRIEDTIDNLNRTQSDIADKANLGHGYLTNILKRGQMPSVEKMDALCKELNVSILWLMYGIDVPPDFHLIQDIAKRDPKKLRAVIELLK